MDDHAGCVDSSLLAEELDAVLVPPAVARVTVSALDESRAVELSVGRGGRVAWSKRFDLVASDCATAPEAIAGSIRAGLGAFPGWLVGGVVPQRAGWNVDLPLTVGVGAGEPTEVRFGLGARAIVDVGRCCFLAGLGAELGTPFAVDIGTAQIAEGIGEVGWIYQPNTSRWFVMGGVRAGSALSWGAGFVEDAAAMVPVGALWFSGGIRATDHLRLAAGVRINVVRLAVAAGPQETLGAAVVSEPWARLELTISPRLGGTLAAR